MAKKVTVQVTVDKNLLSSLFNMYALGEDVGDYPDEIYDFFEELSNQNNKMFKRMIHE